MSAFNFQEIPDVIVNQQFFKNLLSFLCTLISPSYIQKFSEVFSFFAHVINSDMILEWKLKPIFYAFENSSKFVTSKVLTFLSPSSPSIEFWFAHFLIFWRNWQWWWNRLNAVEISSEKFYPVKLVGIPIHLERKKKLANEWEMLKVLLVISSSASAKVFKSLYPHTIIEFLIYFLINIKIAF